MPKQSVKKRQEREQAQAKLKTDVREKKPFENYLGFVKEMNKKREVQSRQKTGGRLTNVASLPNLHPRNANSEQKIAPFSPHPID